MGKNQMTAVQINQHQIQIEQQINQINDMQAAEQVVKKEKIKVAVRVRPFISREVGKENVCYVSKNCKQIRVSDLGHTVEGTYDKVFPIETSQNEAYSFVNDCIPNLLQGFNCTIFAYGQTGSGKTYTMFGEGFDQQKHAMLNSQQKSEDLSRYRRSVDVLTKTDDALDDFTISSRRGIIPRSVSELFTQIKAQNLKYTIYCSFLQIYNEKLFDLLQDTYTKNPLQIREDKFQGIYVEGLTEYVVQDEIDCLNLLTRGEKNRIKRATKMNIKSSRSHTLFQLLLETDKVDNKGMLKRAKLNLGDLAGSEKINKDEEMKTKHMLELRNINLSLTTLGKVIQVLSTQSSTTNPHVPFRESKLTRLLQDSLGGNCQTYLIATVSPLFDSIEETISTLKFADRAKCVMQRVKKNEINAKDDALVQKLQKEVMYLKDLLQMKRKGFNPNDLSHQLYILKDENERLRQIAMNFEDVEKMKEENKLMRLELQRLKQIGASDIGSTYNGDSSPKSFTHFFNQGTALKQQKSHGRNGEVQNDGNTVDSRQVSSFKSKEGSPQLRNPIRHQNDLDLQKDNTIESDDQSIGDQFNHYKSEINFEVKLDKESRFGARQSQHNMAQSNLVTDRTGNMTSRSGLKNNQFSYDNDNQQNDIIQMKQQKDRLQQVIQDKSSLKSVDNNSKTRQGFQVKKRYQEGELSDEASTYAFNIKNSYQQSKITLPNINDSRIGGAINQNSLYSKVDFSRKASKQDMIKKIPTALNLQGSLINRSSHYSLNRLNNPTLQSNDSYLSDITKQQQQSYPIQKYPGRQMHMRKSIGSNEEFQNFGNNNSNGNQMSQIGKEINKSQQMGSSSGIVGMTTQSSLYGGGSATRFNQNNFQQFKRNSEQQNENKNGLQNQSQTIVRIRGRHNKFVETKGNIMMTLDEEKILQEKRKQLRRSNERLQMLESMERARHDKMHQEIQKIENDRMRREIEAQKKKEQIRMIRKNRNESNGGIVSGGGNASESTRRNIILKHQLDI